MNQCNTIERLKTVMVTMVICIFCALMAHGQETAGPGLAQSPNLAITNMSVLKDGFIYITLENQSDMMIPLNTQHKEKIFLVIFIDDLKRAEYKLKYIDPKLFKPKSKVLFRTNFRVPGDLSLKIRAEINEEKIITELTYLDNRLEKIFPPSS